MEREYLIGIDLCQNEINAGLVDLNGKIVKKLTLPTDIKSGKNKVVENIVFAINKLRKDNILGVGIGFPGAVDSKRGLIVDSRAIPIFKNTNLKKAVEEKVKLPVFVENNAKCFSIAEYKVEFGKKVQNLLGVTVGSNIDCGLIINGKMYKGSFDSAGSIGHTTIMHNGEKCDCGSLGCLESYASERAIAKKLKRISGKNLCTDEMSQLVKSNKRAKTAIEEAGYYFGIGLSNAISILNPDLIVINGPVASIKGFIEAAEKEAHRRMKNAPKKTQIVKSALEDSGILGAASIVF